MRAESKKLSYSIYYQYPTHRLFKKNSHYTWVSYAFRLVSLNSRVPHLLRLVSALPLLLHFWPIFKCCPSCASLGTLLCHPAQQEKLDRKTKRFAAAAEPLSPKQQPVSSTWANLSCNTGGEKQAKNL